MPPKTVKRTKDEVVTGRIDKTLSRELDALAEATHRSKSFLVAEAIEQYVELQTWQIEGIKQAQASVRAGRTIPHEKVMASLARYRTAR